ncbi:zinc metallopeptidase, putative [Pseudooceanicola batsensis HTCC2597]|uniref:Zinc metallopeptidase, putative n=1 Tax=Pseudooceanicola batsensis (strain ATCC BAA-863 / DSM 15984 / KCTC 12145 / HTCC2597) TaxID=252305 RepID=A3TVP5_PSEBH|nr:neutral zinc metallopeptidase [Pseudooceanicola batsensis]EAQ03691.1 zinc metallopeptidase, putative [Pseudooceanicola batsensis HTCC2597]
MRLRGVRRSRNIEDRRRSRGRGGAIGGLGIGGVLVVLAIGYFTGIDVRPLLDGAPQQSSAPRALTPAEERAADFSASVLATTEDVWSRLFPAQVGTEYAPPVLVLFSGRTESPCGGASGATGPFYCPADRKAYLDTQFFATLSERLGAGGDFAAAYVIAHEVAHHVQNELGILARVHEARRQSDQTRANALTVRLELQADCLSGVWAAHVDGLLEPGDIEEALNAARMIGDDHLQRQAGRVPQPHTFTHGTSDQRARWFENGYDTGEIGACDTFAADRL